MEKDKKELGMDDVSPRVNTREEINRVQEIEGNPFTQEDLEMFQMFNDKGWTEKQRRDYILEQAKREMAASRIESK